MSNCSLMRQLRGYLAIAVFFVMPTVWADVSDDGLIAHYQYNNNLVDSSDYNNHGSNEGSSLFTTDRFGNANRAIQFDGETHQDVISVDDINDLYPTKELTVAVWVKANKDGVIVQQGGLCYKQGRSFNFHITKGGHLKMSVYSGSGSNGVEVETHNTIPSDGNWHHLAGVFNHGQITLYIDGLQQGTASENFDGMAASDDRISIGHMYSYCDDASDGYANHEEYAFAGAMDDLRLYTRALSEKEIEAIVALEKWLIAHYEFDNDLSDSSGHYNHGSSVSPLFTTDRFQQDDSAIQFNGNTHQDVILVNEIQSLPVTDALTVTAWVKSERDGVIVQQGGFCPEKGRSFDFQITNGGRLKMSVFGNSESDPVVASSNNPIPPDGNWHHLVGVFDRGQITLYIDGLQQGGSSGNFTEMADSIDRISIGHIYPSCGDATSDDYANHPEYAFAGAIDDLRFYNRALSEYDIEAICCKPLAYFWCEDIDNTDYSEQAKHWSVDCDASSSSVHGGDITGYHWTIDKPDGSSDTFNGAKQTFEFDIGKATYPIKLTVTDNNDRVSQPTLGKIKIRSLFPVAKFTATPVKGQAPLTVTLDATESYDPDGTIVSYEWITTQDVEKGKKSSVTFDKPMTHKITLIVTDNDGDVGSANENVTVCQANMTVTDDEGNEVNDITSLVAPVTLQLEASDSTTYQWSGECKKYGYTLSNSSEKKATLTFGSDNICTVKLSIRNKYDCEADTEKKFEVKAKPTAKIHKAEVLPFSCVREDNLPLQLSLDASDSYDTDGNISQYEWKVCPGDKADCAKPELKTGKGQIAEIPVEKIGPYAAMLTVTDNDGLQSEASIKIELEKFRVKNCPPVPVALVKPTFAKGPPLTVELDGSQSYDLYGENGDQIAKYEWLSYPDNQPIAVGEKASFTYPKSGEYLIILKVTDQLDAEVTNKSEPQKVIVNYPPIAEIKLTTTEEKSGRVTVNVDGSASRDPDGHITDYQWTSSDGKTAKGKAAASFTYVPGKYTIELTVADNHQVTRTASKQTVPFRPIAKFTTKQKVIEPEADGKFLLYLDASDSIDPDGGTIKRYDGIVIYPDGSRVPFDEEEPQHPLKNHYVEECGDYQIILMVTDDEGKESHPEEKPVKVNCQPEAQFDVIQPTFENQKTLTLDGEYSSDTDGKIVKYQWEVCPTEDNIGPCKSVPNKSVAPIKFEHCGESYSVTLTVEDDQGAVTTSPEETIKVNCLPKPVFIPHYRFGHLPVDLFLDASGSCDTDGNITDYKWTVRGCDQDKTLSGQQAELRLTEECTYKVTLTVTDNESSTDVMSHDINTKPYNNTARPGPQIIAAGVSPSQVDNKDSEFDVIAIVRPGLSSIRHVSFKDTSEQLVNVAMIPAGVLPNGDEIYKFTYGIEPGILGKFTLSTAWGSGDKELYQHSKWDLNLGLKIQFNIVATGKSGFESHTFPFLIISDLKRINDFQPEGVKKSEEAIIYNTTARQGPQIIMAGYSPAILHVGDDQFDLIAVVRAGALPIKSVTLKHNSDQKFAYTMEFIGELENGDQVYKMTYTYPRGALGTEPYSHKDLWGPTAQQFGIEVIDKGDKRSHKFPDIKFGNYPEWDGNFSTGCESVR